MLHDDADLGLSGLTLDPEEGHIVSKSPQGSVESDTDFEDGDQRLASTAPLEHVEEPTAHLCDEQPSRVVVPDLCVFASLFVHNCRSRLVLMLPVLVNLPRA